jgi:hypothetical protein
MLLCFYNPCTTCLLKTFDIHTGYTLRIAIRKKVFYSYYTVAGTCGHETFIQILVISHKVLYGFSVAKRDKFTKPFYKPLVKHLYIL